MMFIKILGEAKRSLDIHDTVNVKWFSTLIEHWAYSTIEQAAATRALLEPGRKVNLMRVKSINPNNGSVIREFVAAGPHEIGLAVTRAREAQRGWAALSLNERAEYFTRLADVMRRNTKQLLELMKLETGKRIPDGEAEVYDVIDAVDYYAKLMSNVHPDRSVQLNPQSFPNTDLEINYVPFGVIGLIMPWNFPLYSPGMYVIAALTAGNGVVLKPSENSTLMGIELQRQFHEAGFPAGLVEVIIGADETGKALVKSDVDKIFFVGSVEAGKDIIAHAGVKPVQVELGGNSAALVFGDADLDLAARGISWAGTYHAGQDCVGIKRVYVVSSVADEFVKRLTDIVSNLRPAIDYGPLITSQALETVVKRIDNAVAHGAKLLCGGRKIQVEGRGFWLSPSVILYTDPSLELVCKETFGNTVPVMVVRDEDEAVRRANATTYGLSNAVFSRDLSQARTVADKLESGMVFINEPFIAIPGWDHWTGWKESGFGTTESKLMQCLKKKVVSVNRDGVPRTFWYPYPNSD